MSDPRPSPLHLPLWLVQWPLAAAFFLLGLLELGVAPAELQGRLGLLPGAATGALDVVGALQVALALALVVPAATRFVPVLTPVAAGCLALSLAAGLSGLATDVTPFGLGYPAVDALLAAAASFVAWGRFAPAPLAPIDLGPETDDAPRRGRDWSEPPAARHGRRPGALRLAPDGGAAWLPPSVRALRGASTGPASHRP